MAIVAVTFDGTRLNSADTNTGWGNYNSGGGTPASEAANAYQISTGAGANTGAVGKKVNSTTTRVGVDYNGTAVDYTATANRLWYCKIYIADGFDLNTTWGVEVGIGSADQSNFHQYNIAGSGANLTVYSTYPAQGGYIITCIDPTIDTWAEVADSGGTTDQTALLWYGLGAVFQNGNAKSENVAMDAIDYGTGLTLLNGTGADPVGTWVDFVDNDQGIINNRWGAAIGLGNSVVFRGIATIGSATATEFTDNTSIVTFPDGYHSAGLFGVAVDLSNASSVIEDNALLIGQGTRNASATNDTRPDYIVTGTSGTFTSSAQMRNFRNITFTSACTLDGANIACQLLTQSTAVIKNSTIGTNALSAVACLQTPSFGVTTGINNTDFVQLGAGHAIEFATVGGTYTMTNLTFTGYGADTTNDAALYISAATGTTTINYTGATPTYRTAGATVVLTASYTLTLTDIPTGVNVTIVNSSTRAELQHTDHTGGDITFGHSGGTTVDILLNSLAYDPNLSDVYDLTLPTNDSSIKFQMLDDLNYNNPA